MRPDGSAKRIFRRPGNWPSWSPDGQWLAFVGADAQLWKIKANGDEPTKITKSGKHFYPSWSFDGKWIASSTSLCRGDSTCGIWLTLTDGSRSLWLSIGGGPCWHPQQEELIWVGMADGVRGVVLHDLETGTEDLLYDLTGKDVSAWPRYSPDGSSILLGLDFQLWILDSDGSNPRRLMEDEHRGQACWSPDGNRIAFGRKNGLWIINSDGSNPHQITFPPN